MEQTKKGVMRKWNISDVYDVISMILIAVSLLFSAYRFSPVFNRLVRSVVDLGLSIAYYFTELSGFEGTITPTVATIPEGIESVLPLDWETFQAQLQTFGELLISEENFKDVFSDMLSDFANVMMNIVLFLPSIICLIVLISMAYTKTNNNFSRKTKPRRIFEAIENKTYVPAKEFISGYIWHLREKPLAWRIFVLVWLYNLNVLTMLVGAFAYLFYFCIAFFEIHSFYAQIVKLGMDLTVAIGFLPWWAWAIVGYKIFDHIRRGIGMAFLRAYEAMNRAFLNTYLGALFLVGKQRAKKTTIITDMALTQEMIFRDEAKERLSLRDKQFPFFPWQEVERFYRITQANHSLPTLASIREFVKELQVFFRLQYSCEDRAVAKGIKRHYAKLLKRVYGYIWTDPLFGYDWERHGLTYCDNLKVIDVFEALEGYMQLYYIYAAPTSLIFGNYSIRTDLQWQDHGNFPEIVGDFFNRNAEEVMEESQYSHVAKLDCFRLGNVVNPSDPYINGFELGIVNMMEIAKERGNQNSNAGVKMTDAGVNAKNDLWEMNMKMQTHASTIDNYTFFRLLMDDQRADSLSAENKDLCDVILIKGVSDPKIVMPGFLIEEGIYALATKIHDAIYYKLRNLRGDANNTLLVYLLKKLYNPIFKHYDRISKQFSVYTAKLKIWDAMQDEVLSDKGRYYISMKKTYSERFATDGIKQFYHKKALRSKYGLNDFPSFKGKHISVEEMDQSGSLFYKKIIDKFHMRIMKQEMEKEQKTKKQSGKDTTSVA